MRPALSDKALRLLDRFESIEVRSLEWGYTEGSLSEDEALDLANEVSGDGHGDDLLEELITARLIVEISSSSGAVRIRSRFAEMIRLLAASRQLFPNKPWQSAPPLVADFRIDHRARRFPRRDRDPADFVAQSNATIAKSALRKELWDSLTSQPGMKLAAFQERAAMRLGDPNGDCGTIVTAGTGSGKTLAFYLPAIIRIGEAISPEHFVKAIAIYPRIELLKDQIAEAYRMARATDQPLRDHGRRALRIGALFAATPPFASPDQLSQREWRAHGADFICPWLRCPACNADLVWRATDIEAKRERLTCVSRECGNTVSEDHIVLTRRRLQKEPPDILFTTTEILNQRLSDQWMRGLFGVGIPLKKKPTIALLDEVHTYEGAPGAQAALTLRRWRYLLEAPIHWVGLSATLGDATRFFADLTGVNPDQVAEITPTADEFEEEGAEYQILLRGDPTSRVSLLSTTIQASMLVPRTLDPPGQPVSRGAFGSRAFLFTDDLDVTNRLYDDLRDAEAYTIFGQPDQRRDPLASLRAGGPDAALRDVEGQRWRMCEEIGHPLNRRLVVGRTTSQDAGVNKTANIVVATSALEVGFNDPEVGAVIQHKAPRGMASFLQRKGRAGRDRRMRPIMLTVLSDYGRDRSFYHAYEHLFDPTIEAQHLPIRNPYVLKIQAVFAFIDWIAAQTAGFEKSWFWDILSRPIPNPSPSTKVVIDSAKELLTKLVRGDEALLSSLCTHLVGALAIERQLVDMLLWEAPRSLLLEAVPTLVRRLFRNWKLAFPDGPRQLDLQSDYHPLPDFVPRTLFSDLSLPEVRVIVPPATINHQERIEAMPILQALNQLAPGRVTRRFAFERGALSHWVSVDPSIPIQEMRVSEYAEEHEFIGSFQARCNDDIDEEPLLVFRPWQVRLRRAARTEALPSSNARLSWRTDIEPNGDPLIVNMPPRTQWRTYIREVGLYLHRFRASVSVRRFAPSANVNIRTLQDDFPVKVRFRSDDGGRAAIGFELEVDGLYIDLELPPAQRLIETGLPWQLLASSKLAYARDHFLKHAYLPEDLNTFQREWLFQILISAVLASAVSSGKSFAEAATLLLEDRELEATFQSAMSELFGALPPSIPEGEEANEDEIDDAEAGATKHAQASCAAGSSRLQEALVHQLGRFEVRDALRATAMQLCDPEQTAFDAWLRRTVLETLGEAMLQACVAASPRHATVDTLLIDIQETPHSGIARVWITESTIGGAGVLQAFAERFSAEPRLFFSALESALAPTDLELTDSSLRQILVLAENDTQISDLFSKLRASSSHVERATIWREFSAAIASKGSIELSHAFAVSLNTRLLRPGSGPELDHLVRTLQGRWDELEKSFELTIGLREFAFICSNDASVTPIIRRFLSKTIPGAAINSVTINAAVTTLLWPREAELRQKALHAYHPYRDTRTTDPGLVRHLLLTGSIATVDLENKGWQAELQAALAAHGICRLSAPTSAVANLRHALVNLSATPVDVGVLQFFPVLERLERAEGKMIATLALREQV